MGTLSGWAYRKSVTVSENVTVTGTIAVTNGSAAIVGTGSNFTSWSVGDKIQCPDTNWYTIATITDATHLTISVTYPGSNASGQAYDMQRINYQVKLTVYSGAGTDSTGVIYLNSHCSNWPTDILFTLSDGTTTAGADFWREVNTTTSGTWWLEANSISANPNGFHGYVYYGKIDAADASSIANTFITGDDFKRADSATVGNGWTETESGSALASISGNTLLLTQASVDERPNVSKAFTAITTKAHVRMKMKQSSTTIANSDNLAIPGTVMLRENGYISHVDSGWRSLQTYAADTYYTIDFYFTPSAESDIYVDGTKRWDSNNKASSLSSWGFKASGSRTGTFNVAYCFIGNWATNEPTWGASGTEENLLYIPYVNPIFQLLAH